jgi:hypothetical protein
MNARHLIKPTSGRVCWNRTADAVAIDTSASVYFLVCDILRCAHKIRPNYFDKKSPTDLISIRLFMRKVNLLFPLEFHFFYQVWVVGI